MVAVVVPLSAALDELPGLDGSGRPESGDQFAMPAHLEPENAEAGLRAMKRHAIEKPRKRLSVLILAVGIFAEIHGVSVLEASQKF